MQAYDSAINILMYLGKNPGASGKLNLIYYQLVLRYFPSLLPIVILQNYSLTIITTYGDGGKDLALRTNFFLSALWNSNNNLCQQR